VRLILAPLWVPALLEAGWEEATCLRLGALK